MALIEWIDRAKLLPGVRPVLEQRYERFFARAQDHQLFRGVYRSFDEAARSAPATKPLGYDDAAPAEMYRGRLDNIYPTDYPPLFWLSKLLPAARSLFDFGGHVGVKYYAYSRYLDYPPSLQWIVCDVPAVTAAGAELARERPSPGLSFVTDFESASGVDILFCSGSLQYVETPLEKLLQGLREPPKHVLVSSTPLGEGPSFVTLNSIGTAFCPYSVRQRSEMVRGMQALGYDVVDEWEHPGKTCIIPFHPDRSLLSYRGAYFRTP
jgi:putative methyltransferase (TIGR04325 family)